MPRDAWLLDRRNTQTGPDFFFDTIGAQARQFEAIANSTSLEDMFDRLEACGYFLRLDPDVRPSMFHARPSANGKSRNSAASATSSARVG